MLAAEMLAGTLFSMLLISSSSVMIAFLLIGLCHKANNFGTKTYLLD